MKRIFFILMVCGTLGAEDAVDNDEDTEGLTLDIAGFALEDEYAQCSPCDADVDEVWFWENEAMYPTRKEDSWVEDLSRPW